MEGMPVREQNRDEVMLIASEPEGVVALARAMIDLAKKDLRPYRGKSKEQSQNAWYRATAEHWIGERSDAIMSFDWCCGMSGMDPARVRRSMGVA